MLNVVGNSLVTTHYGRLVQLGGLANGFIFGAHPSQPIKAQYLPVTPLTILQQFAPDAIHNCPSECPVEINFLVQNQPNILYRQPVNYVRRNIEVDSQPPSSLDIFLESNVIPDRILEGFQRVGNDAAFMGAAVRNFNGTLKEQAASFWRNSYRPLREFLAFNDPDSRDLFLTLASLPPSSRNFSEVTELIGGGANFRLGEGLLDQTIASMQRLGLEIGQSFSPDFIVSDQPLKPLLDRIVEDYRILAFGHRLDEISPNEPFYYGLPHAILDLIQVRRLTPGLPNTALAFVVAEAWPLMNSLLNRRLLISSHNN